LRSRPAHIFAGYESQLIVGIPGAGTGILERPGFGESVAQIESVSSGMVSLMNSAWLQVCPEAAGEVGITAPSVTVGMTGMVGATVGVAGASVGCAAWVNRVIACTVPATDVDKISASLSFFSVVFSLLPNNGKLQATTINPIIAIRVNFL
jgi:hypothetical protein